MSTPKYSFNEDKSNREAFYEELNERLLAIECGEYDCGQCDDDLISQESFDDEEEYEEKENCEICEEVLVSHVYGNVCKKHIPSYALYDNDDNEDNEDNEEVDMEGYLTQEDMGDTDIEDDTEKDE